MDDQNLYSVRLPAWRVCAVRHVWSGPEAGAGLGNVHRPQLRRPGDQQGGRLEQIPQQHGGHTPGRVV